MIPVSTEWKNAIREQFRYQGYLEVTLEVTPPGLHESLVLDTDATESVSDKKSIVDKDRSEPTPYITLEKGRWLLNKKYKVLPTGTKTKDWWSTPMTEGAKQLIFTFDQAYTIPGIYVEWDMTNGSYPTQLLIEGYDLSDQKQYSFDVTSISSNTGFVDAPMDNVKKVVMTISAWSRETWRARINEVLFGLFAKYDSINNGRVMSATSVDYSHPLSKELPTHTMKVELRNLDQEFDPSLVKGVAKYLANRQLVKCRWGFVTSYGNLEWTPELYYYMDSFSIPVDQRNVTLNATSRLALLTEKLASVTYDATDRTFYDIALSALSSSKIIKDDATQVPFELSEELKNYRTNAPLPDVAINVLLQYLAGASGLLLYTVPTTGFVKIGSPDTETVQTIGLDQNQGDPEVTVQNTLRSISVGVYSYTKKTEQGKIEVAYSSMNHTGKKTVNLSYNCDYAVEVTCSISGATLISFTPYSNHATVEFDTGDTEKQVEITLSGYEVTKNQTYIETYRNESLSAGLDVTVDNPFITNTDKLKDLTDKLVSWYNKPQQLKVPYLGYPEVTAGDKIDLTTIYGNGEVSTIKSTLDFDGGFNGTLEVR